MIPALKSELRKMLTIRSTYILVILAFLFLVLIELYAKGYKASAADLNNPGLVADGIILALNSLPIILGSIIAILLMTHEYRYSTIMYTLSASNSRSKVLLAKILAISIFALVFTLLLVVLTPLLIYLGAYIHGTSLVAQTVPYGNLFWRCLFYGWSSILAGLLLATLIRNQIGAVVALFVIPTLEQMSALLLKSNAIYLPFMSSNAVLVSPEKGNLSYGHAALIFLGYLVIGWAFGWVLFLRRDAS